MQSSQYMENLIFNIKENNDFKNDEKRQSLLFEADTKVDAKKMVNPKVVLSMISKISRATEQADIDKGLAKLREYHQISFNQEELGRGQQKFFQALEKKDAENTKDPSAGKAIERELTKLGIKTNEQFNQLLSENKEIREQLSIVANYINEIAENKNENAKTQGLISAVGFVSALGQFTGNEDLCRIGALAEAGIQITSCLTALQGPLSLASLNPIVGIGMAVLSIAGMFRKNKRSNTNQILFQAIQALASQLNMLRREMHERFDRIEEQLFEIYKSIIIGFCDVQLDHKKILTLLDDIHHEIVTGKIEMSELMSSLNERIRSIRTMQYTQGRREKIEKLYKQNNKATGKHILNSNDFKELYNEFTSDILTLHKDDPLLVGDSLLTPSETVTHFETDENNPFMAQFHIKSLLDIPLPAESKETPQVINPIIWSWQVMGLMELLKRFYPKEEGANRISKGELDDIEKIARLGNEMVDFSKTLRDPEFLQLWLERYINAGNNLQAQLNSFIQKEEKKITKELDKSYSVKIEHLNIGEDKVISPEYVSSTFDDFKKQGIPVGVVKGYGWFTGLSTGHDNHGNLFYSYNFNDHEQHAQKPIAAYKIERTKSISLTKDNYILAMRNRLGSNHGQFHYFSACNIAHNHYDFAFPNQAEAHYNLILPLPIYRTPIPAALQLAEWMNIGHIEFRYRIEEIEEKNPGAVKKNNFILETRYVLNGVSHLISALTSPYTPGIYNKPGSEQEALWWYWVGGNYVKEGSSLNYVNTEHVEIPGHNTWNHYTYIPYAREHLGRYQEIKKENGLLLSAQEKIIITEESELINTVKNKIKSQLTQYKRMLFNKIKQEIVGNNESDLGKAFVEYSYSFYMLKTILVIAFGENNLDKYGPFYPIINKTGFNSRQEILSTLDLLADKDISPVELISSHMALIQLELPNAINEIISDPHYLTCQEFIMNILNDLIVWYKPLAVDENQLHSKISFEKMQKEQIETYQGVFGCLTDAILSCSPEVQLQFKIAMEKQFAIRGIEPPSSMFPMLTPADSKEDLSSPISPPSPVLQEQKKSRPPSEQSTLRFNIEEEFQPVAALGLFSVSAPDQKPQRLSQISLENNVRLVG